MTAPDPHHEPADPELAVPLSVADILRREGHRAPHAVSGPLRPRGHAGPPVPTLSAPRPPGNGRATAAAMALAVAGAVLGATAVHEAPPGTGTAPDDDSRGSTGAASGRTVTDGRDPGGAGRPPAALVAVSGDLDTDGATGPVAVTGTDLAALADRGPGAHAPVDRGDQLPTGPDREVPENGDTDTDDPSGDDPSGDDPSGDDPSGDDPSGDDPDPGGSGGRGTDGPGTSGPGGGSGSGPAPGDSAAGDGSGPGVGVAVPEVRSPAGTPAAPAVLPGTLRLAPDEASVEGPRATTDEARLGPVTIGAAEIDTPEVSGGAGTGVQIAEAEIDTPGLGIAGATLDPPDLATPAVGLGLR